MQKIIATFLLPAVLLLFGCGPRESQTLIRSLTDEDCERLIENVVPLCAATPAKKKGDDDDDRTWLRGDSIPESLAYLKPRRVYLTDSSATLELWRDAGGNDTIYVICDDRGVWEISVHEGDLLNRDRLIWPRAKGR